MLFLVLEVLLNKIIRYILATLVGIYGCSYKVLLEIEELIYVVSFPTGPYFLFTISAS